MRRKTREKLKLGKISFLSGITAVTLFGLYFILPEMFPDASNYYLANFFIFSLALVTSIFSIALGVIDVLPGKEYEKRLSIVGIVLGCLIIIFGIFMLILSDVAGKVI